MKNFFLFLLVLILPAIAFAQVDPSSMPADLDWSQSLNLIIQSLGGLKGAGALAIAAAVVQSIMLLARSPLGNFAGKFKLLIFVSLSLVSGVLSLRLSGVDWIGALVHSTTLSGVAVLVNQAIKQASKTS